MFVDVSADVAADCNFPTPSLRGEELEEVDKSKGDLAQGDLTLRGIQWNELFTAGSFYTHSVIVFWPVCIHLVMTVNLKVENVHEVITNAINTSFSPEAET